MTHIPTIDVVIGDETAIPIKWEINGEVVDMSGYTFSAKLWDADDPLRTTIFTKTGGMVGATFSPNLTINWATNGELHLAGITEGLHVFEIVATSPTGQEHTMDIHMQLRARG